ncbi:hypothetical protein E2320_007604, partial [Naja naja]
HHFSTEEPIFSKKLYGQTKANKQHLPIYLGWASKEEAKERWQIKCKPKKGGLMFFAPLGLPATRLDEEPLIIPIQSILGRRRGGFLAFKGRIKETPDRPISVFLLTAEAFVARRPFSTADRTRLHKLGTENDEGAARRIG